MKSSKKACKIFAESKLLSAVTVLTRDKNSDFSKIKYLIINKLIFKKRHWKVPYFPQKHYKALKFNNLYDFKKINGTVSGQLTTFLSNAKNIERKKKYV